MICLISFSNFSDVLPAFACASAIGNLLSICFGVHILNCLWLNNLPSETLATQATRSEILVIPSPCFGFGNISLLKALRTFHLPLRSIITFLRVNAFFFFLTDSFGFVDFLKISISSFNPICCSGASSKDKSLS